MNRPAATVDVGDPAVVRSEGIAASPQSPAHRADGLASGSVSECGAGLEDAGDGGSCGQPSRWLRRRRLRDGVSGQSNTGFVDATSRSSTWRMELGGEEFDRDDMRFFTGKRRGLHHQAVRARQLLQELGAAGRPRQLQRGGAGARGGAQPPGQHPLSGEILREAHLLRGVHPPGARLVRVRLQARAHPAGTGAQAARGRLGLVPRPDGGRDRDHRLRGARPLRVHREPRGRRPGARDRPARGGRHAVAHDRPHPRLLPAGQQ